MHLKLLCFSCVGIDLSVHFIFILVLRDAWDMAAEICLSQLPTLVEDPNAEFQVPTTILFTFSFHNLLFT